ncbi:MCE family protein [Amycolatopsis acidicola]|uniref:MCE family protein n=1 Tax=Amycolatopsis acidicola TaxID=2596893 RepID=A0A5N0V3D0_9PSEU|nr:MCE family protein [Amycolatopsis acidicola]KAA9160485.1 MCE family protein [Amycolatopsis acidicola]
MRRTLLATGLAAALVLLTGCDYQDGLNSLPMPGTQGNDDGSYSVRAEFTTMSGMEPNTQVMVDNVNVGSVSKISLQNWHAIATIRLNHDVDLPANATAKVAQTSLLGSKHIELAPPATEQPAGKLKEGSVIGLDHTSSYPDTEDVLASASLLLNGGGLEKVQTITGELNKALGGREQQTRDTLDQLDSFAAGLDRQKGQITAALDGLNRLGKQAADQKQVIEKTLTDLEPALDALNQERGPLIQAMTDLNGFSDAAGQIIDETQGALVTNLRNLEPVLKSLADSGDALVGSTGILATGRSR